MAKNNATNNKASVFTSNTSITATAGDLVITAGNLQLPNTTSAGTAGILKINAINIFNNIGTNNVFIGDSAGNLSLTTASNNVGVGNYTGYGVMGTITTGVGNTVVGAGSLHSITVDNGNCIFGFDSADQGTAGSPGKYNIGFGYINSDNYSGSENSNILIQGTTSGTAGDSNKLRLGVNGTGNGQQSTAYMGGVSGVSIVGSAVLLNTTASGGGNQFGTVASSERFKENITDMMSDAVIKLRPVNFTIKDDKTAKKQYGLIAEEVKEVMPDLVSYDEEGQLTTVKYHLLSSLLLNEIKKQSQRIQDLIARVAILKGRVA